MSLKSSYSHKFHVQSCSDTDTVRAVIGATRANFRDPKHGDFRSAKKNPGENADVIICANTLLKSTSQRGPWGAVVVEPRNVVHAM